MSDLESYEAHLIMKDCRRSHSVGTQENVTNVIDASRNAIRVNEMNNQG